MWPILFRIGPLAIHTYGVLLAIGAGVGLWVLYRVGGRLGLDLDKLQSMALWGLLSGVAGARIGYVAIEPRYFLSHPLHILALWEGGLVFYGGVAAAVAVGAWLAGRWGMNRLKLLDAAAPALAIGQAIGRLGCFAAGCCYGLPTKGWWAVVFNNPNTLAPRGIPLHPVQIYTSVGLGAIFLGLMWAIRHWYTPGRIISLYLLMHGLLRLGMEQLRGDWRGPIVALGLTPTGLMALGMVVIGGIGTIATLRRKGGASGVSG